MNFRQSPIYLTARTLMSAIYSRVKCVFSEIREIFYEAGETYMMTSTPTMQYLNSNLALFSSLYYLSRVLSSQNLSITITTHPYGKEEG